MATKSTAWNCSGATLTETRSGVPVCACQRCAWAQAWRSTNANGTEIDFSSTLSFGAQVRLGKPLADTIGNDNGGNVPTSAKLGAQIAVNTTTTGQQSGPDVAGLAALLLHSQDAGAKLVDQLGRTARSGKVT